MGEGVLEVVRDGLASRSGEVGRGLFVTRHLGHAFVRFDGGVLGDKLRGEGEGEAQWSL